MIHNDFVQLVATKFDPDLGCEVETEREIFHVLDENQKTLFYLSHQDETITEHDVRDEDFWAEQDDYVNGFLS